ncbi:MAG: HAMP domain-containing protein [Actinomycetales bacterium]|nr:HAMP domain-containing protein [Actinomycetales bacterium]
MPSKLTHQLTNAWERVSLRSKLTTLSVALIGILLLVSSFGTISLLRTYLQQNMDTMLVTTATTLSNEDPTTIEARLASRQLDLPRLPSDYYIAYLDSAGNLLIGLVSSAASSDRVVPNLSQLTLAQVVNTGGSPFEVSISGSEAKDDDWRMVALPLKTLPGSVVVALPTNANTALIGQYTSIGAGFGILLLVISGVAIWVTISQALRPLREVERTAASVASGDIGSRLLEHPGKTEIARLNRSLNSMLGSIETAMDSRNRTLEQMRQFVADASHELRTPLVSVRGYAELYRMGVLKNPADVADAMQRIESEAIRMSGLVESLLTLARLDEGTKITLGEHDLVSLARAAAKDASVADQNREIALVDLESAALSADADLVAVYDPNQMRQVLTNLLANACRFSPEGAAVELAIGTADGKVIFEVRDHGEGIPEQLRAKVFERFYRADNSRNRETGGSGLGLSIVSTIVARHAGTVSVHETAGGGATFRVEFPIAAE